MILHRVLGALFATMAAFQLADLPGRSCAAWCSTTVAASAFTHHDEILTAHVLDLGVYEFGNVLLRALHWSAEDTADQIDDLLVICGPPLAPTPQWRREAATLAHQHRLTFYVALFVAVARALDAPLVSMDRQLLAADLAETPAMFASRIGLVP